MNAYALACGACYRKTFDNHSRWITLWAEHGVYHVRLYDRTLSKAACWNTYTRLTDAKAFFSQICKAEA
jgi:hypothetical protein